MIRTLCFLVAVCCCIGLISGSYTAILDTGDEVTFTEEVMLGDPAVLDGRVAKFGIHYSNHLLWDFTCRFGPELECDTEVIFSQNAFLEYISSQPDALNVYAHSGWGVNTTGDLGLKNDGYGALLSTVSAITPNGQRREMNLRLADFVDYHALNYELHYRSDRYICIECVDQLSYLSGVDGRNNSPCYEAFCQLFRFPVQEDDIVTVSVSVNEAGGLTDIYYDSNTAYMVSVVSCTTDQGIYCVPVYRNESTNTAIPGEHAQGMGVYFIPWMEYDDGSSYADGLKCVTMDVANAKNICPLPDDSTLFGMTLDEQTGDLWLLNLEDERYVITRLGLEDNQMRDRFVLMECVRERKSPRWYFRDGLSLVCANDQVALVTTGDAPALEFIAPAGEVWDGFLSFRQESTAMVYEDGLLYLADAPYRGDELTMMVFADSGPVFWGRYTPSLFECNDLGGTTLWTRNVLTELE